MKTAVTLHRPPREWRQRRSIALAAIALFGLTAVATAHGPGPGGTHGGAIISNGLIKLGVDQSANLNIPGSVRSVSGTFITGVRLIKPGIGELEYTADGCTCEGWGVADAASGFTAYANDSSGYGGYSVTSFSASSSSAVATSVTTSGGARQLQVTHDYHPSATPNLFEVDVTITNIGSATVSDLRYRRVMDWDIEPTPFAELVSIYAGWPTPPSAVLRTDNNGFNSGNPLSFGSYGYLNQNFDRVGPRDHGAVFDFGFGALAPGQVKRFRTYYGAANNRAAANAALATVGAEVWSFGEPNRSLSDPAYSTAIFAFKGVSSRPLANAGPDQNVAVNAVTLNGSASSDPAGGPLSYVWTEGASTIATGATPTVSLSAGVHVLTLTVTSAVTGLTDSDTVVITVTRPADTTPPVINCPLDAHGDTDPGRCTSVLNPGTATAVDDVDGPVAVTGVRSDGLPLSAPYSVGETTITWRAVDAAGNVSECHQMVTVHDEEAPSIVVPGNISRSNDAGQCVAVVSVGSATATDNCSVHAVTGVRSDGLPLNAPYPVGATVITWTAVDHSGNTSSGVQVVTVSDTEAPVLSAPGSITRSNDAGKCSSAVDAGTATATDNCGVVSITGVRSDGAALGMPYPVGVTTITWTAADAAGNTASGSSTVTVNDTEAPALTPPANVSRPNDAGKCSATVGGVAAAATDNCGVSAITGVRSDGAALTAPYPVGTTTITWTATDAAGNSSSGSSTVTVIDAESPVLTAPANVTQSNDPGKCFATVNAGAATATDNCAVAAITGVRSDGQPLNASYPVGTTTITWTVTDTAGLSASAVQTVTVKDTEAPTVACVPTTNPSGGNIPSAGNNPKSGQNPDGFYQLLSADNCDLSPKIYIGDTASSFVTGPFKSGDKVKITQAVGKTPSAKPMAGVIISHIQIQGDAVLWAVDDKGNKSPVHICYVAPKPK